MKKALFLLGFLFGAGAVALWASGLLWSTSQHPPAAAPTVSLSDEEKAYKERLEFYGKRADDLERLLSLLLAGSTIYALAVGYNAYQQAKDAKDKIDALKDSTQERISTLIENSQRQADKIAEMVNQSKTSVENQATQIAEAVTQSKTSLQEQASKFAEAVAQSETSLKDLISRSSDQIKRMESQVARNFPLFRDMDFAISTITHTILHLLPTLDVVDGKFQQLSEQQKQQILFYEKAMSTFEFFNTESLQSEISGMFHGLGNFYALKFKAAENQKKQAGQGDQATSSQNQEVNEQDRERARFYLDKAIEEDSRNMAALNDRGYFALVFERPENNDVAQKSFLSSLDADPDQQRARYNLALIEHHSKNYAKSLELIEAALQKKKWQKTPVPERIPDLWYNRACSLACLAGTKPDAENKKLLESAMKDLEQIADAEKAGWLQVHEAFEDDLNTKSSGANKDGDLISLLTPEFAVRVENVRRKLTAKANSA